EERGVQALFVRCDVREEADVARAVEQTSAKFGRLDCAVNSAGVGGQVAPLEAVDQGDWDDVMRVNARGVWLSMRYEIPAMLKWGGGSVVNLSSIYGASGKPALHAYVASKHAVLGMTRSLALEYATRGVRVNAICAGLTRTPGVEQAEAAVPEVVEQLVSQHPMARMASVDEIAYAALWLCSDGASYVTGAALPVDAGFLAV
ncbi:MAG TPA: SDR family oxidoreductase, partial [Polyangiaceae bacterium]|nr:SDR family oxidoreductase [Polyangiaceae bacterium]